MKDGQYLLVPEVEVDTYWTSLADDPYQAICCPAFRGLQR